MSADRQPGPCDVCGATNYALSFGGPGICPRCDCGIQPTWKDVAAARLAGVEAGLAAAALAVAADHGSSYRGVEHAINRIRALDAAAVAARGRG